MTDREKLTKLVEESFADQHNRRRMIVVPDTVNHLIANGVVVREKGEWVLTDARFAEMSCSLCGFTYYGEYDKECMSDFCPQCGSDMRGAVNNG